MADIFSDIFKFAGSVVNQALTPDNLRDQRHASRLFVDDQYRLVPKMGYLYHVFFDINSRAAKPDTENPLRDSELGMLVKSVALPKFTVDTKRYNAYNRPNYAQTKINYDAINIGFHDDSANVVRNFWFDYYNYYYRDADYNKELYSSSHKYEPTRMADKWGYSPRDTATEPYLKSIRIYSLHQKKFSEYVLLNPIIKSFRHGDHASSSTAELMSHEMTIEYESVLYFYGTTSSSTVDGFADLHYDKMPSPLTPAGGGTKSILGPGGLFDTGDDVIHDLKDGNYGSALFKGLKGLKSAGSMDLKKAAIGELLSLGTGVLRGNNPQNSIFIPSLPSLGGALTSIGGQLGFGGLGLGAGLIQSQEMSDASSYIDEQYPGTPYDEFPSPTEEDVIAAGINESDSSSPESSLNDGEPTTPTNQASVNSFGDSIRAQVQNQAIINAISQNQADAHFAQRQLASSQEAEAMFTQKYNEAVAQYGSDSPAAKNLNSLVNQEIVKQSDSLQKINQLSSQAAGLDRAQDKNDAISGSTS